MSKLLRTCLVLSALWALALPAAAEKRVALVIGNGAYKNTIELPNAPSDARAVAGSLRRLGFQVVDGTNLTQSGMTDKLKEFSRALVGAEVGIFFYAGHGMQVAGENYLVAVDAALKREGDLEFETLKVDQVLRQMQRETKVKVVILDACRDNPLAQELTRSMSSSGTGARSRSTAVASGMGAIDTSNATGTLIAFATAPGSVALDGNGRNSPFTEALLANMEVPGIDIDVMMKRVRGQVTKVTGDRQQPWTNSSLTAEFFLNPAAPAAVAQAPSAKGVVTAALSNDSSQPRGTGSVSAGFDREQALWEEAKKSNSTKDYQAYLEAYPNGTFAGLARNRIDAGPSGPGGSTAKVVLSAEQRSAEASEATEEKMALDNRTWKDVQRRLTGLGFYSRTIDGEAGPGTRKAVTDWQKARGYNATGYFNGLQHTALLAEDVPEKKIARAKDDDEEDKTKARTRSAGSSESPRRSSGGGGSSAGGSNGSAAAAAILGGAVRIAIGSGVLRRR